MAIEVTPSHPRRRDTRRSRRRRVRATPLRLATNGDDSRRRAGRRDVALPSPRRLRPRPSPRRTRGDPNTVLNAHGRTRSIRRERDDGTSRRPHGRILTETHPRATRASTQRRARSKHPAVDLTLFVRSPESSRHLHARHVTLRRERRGERRGAGGRRHQPPPPPPFRRRRSNPRRRAPAPRPVARKARADDARVCSRPSAAAATDGREYVVALANAGRCWRSLRHYRPRRARRGRPADRSQGVKPPRGCVRSHENEPPVCERPVTASSASASRATTAPPKASPRRHAKRNVPDVVSETMGRGEIDPRASLAARRSRNANLRRATSATTTTTAADEAPKRHHPHRHFAGKRSRVSAAARPRRKTRPGRARGRDALERGAVRRDPRRRDASSETSRQARESPMNPEEEIGRLQSTAPPRPRPRPNHRSSHRRCTTNAVPPPPRTPRARAPRPARSDGDAARGNRGDGDPTTGRRARRPFPRRCSFRVRVCPSSATGRLGAWRLAPVFRILKARSLRRRRGRGAAAEGAPAEARRGRLRRGGRRGSTRGRRGRAGRRPSVRGGTMKLTMAYRRRRVLSSRPRRCCHGSAIRARGSRRQRTADATASADSAWGSWSSTGTGRVARAGAVLHLGPAREGEVSRPLRR